MKYIYVCKLCGTQHTTTQQVDSVYCECAWKHIEVTLITSHQDDKEVMVARLRDGTLVILSPSEVAALRIIVKCSILGGTLTSTALDSSTRRTLNKLAKRDIVSIGHADERDSRTRCYSINDWRVTERVVEMTAL